MKKLAQERRAVGSRRPHAVCPDYVDDEDAVPSVEALLNLARSHYVGNVLYIDDCVAVLPLRLAAVDRIDPHQHNVAGNPRLLVAGPNGIRGYAQRDDTLATWLDLLKRFWTSKGRCGGKIPGWYDWQNRQRLESVLREQQEIVDRDEREEEEPSAKVARASNWSILPR